MNHDSLSQLSLSDIRVILVEDDDDLRQSLADYLRLRGLLVTEAASGIAYYQALRSTEYDVAILDINLPDILGYDLARELAAERRTGIILLTAMTDSGDRQRGYENGADVFLSKPVAGEELFLAVANLARRLTEREFNKPKLAEKAAGPSDLAWRLNLKQHALIAPDECRVALTGKEVVFLQAFAGSYPGITVSRNDLSAALGYHGLGPESRSLDALLRRLRIKVQESGSELPVHSIYAVGICFSAPLIVVLS